MMPVIPKLPVVKTSYNVIIHSIISVTLPAMAAGNKFSIFHSTFIKHLPCF